MANSTTQFGGFLTNVGIAQQANSAALGVPWSITHMLIGDGGGDPAQFPDPVPKPTQTALVHQVLRAQLNALYPSPADPAVLVAELVLPPETGGWWIRELALEDANGNFVAVASPAPSYKPLLVQGSGRTQTIRMHVVFGNVANITLKIDPSIVLATREYVDKAREAAELYARNQLKAHTDAANPHPQYLLRSAVAKDSGPLAWLGDAVGTANALTLTLKHAEATLMAYAAGQRFQFKATASNTGPVTAKIGALAAVAVKKSEGGGLVDLVGGDIRAGALYDLNYDGTYFQLGGGVGAGKAFERFSFEASVGQAVFPVPHTVGNVIVMRNGREVSEFLSDGQAVTLQQPCDFGESVQILAFSSFQSANTYTKAEVDALLTASAGLPVGTMLPFPKGTVPPGFLEVDGSLQSAAAYPDLAAYLGTTFNTGGEPAGYFRLPESRGEFLRGWDHGRGVDAGRSIGSIQGDAIRNLSGTLGKVYRRADSGEATGVYANSLKSPGQIVSGSNIADQTVEIKFDASLQVPTAAENRPRNLAVMWCVKAWNAPVNQGQIDVAALAPLAAQATEIKLGTAKVATQDQLKAGAADDVIVTPKKLRWGFAWSFTPNGYIIFPDWLMGFVLVWGFIAGAAGARNISFPTAFPTECLGLMLTGQANQTVAAEYNDQWINSYTKDGAVIYAESTQTVRYFGFGN
ncbi:Phage-related tail fibre protein [Pseudomonas guariconensis]|uniref:phage tail-collar fiber domain-containing protein n=1 Tax=Pseudomonas guariconensis TaxID=1288410 RepID=UPI000887FC87|nr:phage tail protein [Pseudomonas guariconensis]SDC64302.1 Phage-related tail fibre protein [Pseudomonas guariconensis]